MGDWGVSNLMSRARVGTLDQPPHIRLDLISITASGTFSPRTAMLRRAPLNLLRVDIEALPRFDHSLSETSHVLSLTPNWNTSVFWACSVHWRMQQSFLEFVEMM
jgi:hypothetical protein